MFNLHLPELCSPAPSQLGVSVVPSIFLLRRVGPTAACLARAWEELDCTSTVSKEKGS